MRGCVGVLGSNDEGAASFICFRQTPCGALRGMIMRSIVGGGEGGRSEKRAVFRKGEGGAVGGTDFARRRPAGLETGWRRPSAASEAEPERLPLAIGSAQSPPLRLPFWATRPRNPNIDIPATRFWPRCPPRWIARAHGFLPIDRSAPRRTAVYLSGSFLPTPAHRRCRRLVRPPPRPLMRCHLQALPLQIPYPYRPSQQCAAAATRACSARRGRRQYPSCP